MRVERELARVVFLRHDAPPSLATRRSMSPQRDPWHSLTQNVHHTWDECSVARKVTLAGAVREGRGGRPFCSECEKLSEKHAGSPKPEPPRDSAR